MSNDKLREAAQRILDHFYAPDGVYQPIDNTRRREFERLMRKLGAALADSADAPPEVTGEMVQLLTEMADEFELPGIGLSRADCRHWARQIRAALAAAQKER